MQDIRRPPDFIIGGAMRAGTTSLWTYLRQHPKVCMADVKEPFFFADESAGPPDLTDPLGQTGNFRAGWDWYVSLYSRCLADSIRGEGTAPYLHTPSTPALIEREAPDAKLIFVLRDPSSRAYSHYWLQRQGRDLPPFDQLVREREPLFLRYIEIGRYAQHLERFFDSVGRDRILVFLFEELRDNPRDVVDRSLRFIGADPTELVALDATPRNQAVAARSKSFERLIQQAEVLDARYPVPEFVKGWARSVRRRVRRSNLRPVDVPPLAADLRLRMVEMLIADIERLERLLEVDLSAWKQADGAPVHPGGDDVGQ